MRILVNGQQAFGRAVLEALLERGENVVGVYTAPDRPGKAPDPLKEAAQAHGLPIFQPKSFRRPAVWEQMRELKPDIGVMAYVTLFVPESALAVPRLGTIQYHPSLLPLHKGPSAINWPIIFGETRTGLTIFWPDEGLDTGPVLLRKEVTIGPDDTLGSLYFNQLFPMGVAAMLESVDAVRDGVAPKTSQEELLDAETLAAVARVQGKQPDGYAEVDIGTYEGWCRAEQARVDWGATTKDIHNLIRGCDPQPGAWTTHDGRKLQLFAARIASTGGSGGGNGGEVVAVDAQSFTVRAGDGGAIAVSRVRQEKTAKQDAGAFAEEARLRPGDRLGAAGE